MKHFHRHYYVLALLILIGNARVMAASEDEYNKCVLDYQKGAKNDTAAVILESACRVLYRDDAVLFAREVALQQCLLKNIPGVESSAAVSKIRDTCYSENQ